MTTTEKTRTRPTFAELGPTWIVAIATLIGALATAGFFAGRVTAPPVDGPTESQVGAAQSRTPVGTTNASAAYAEGQEIAHFTVDLPPYYGLDFGPEPSKPKSVSVANGTTANLIKYPLFFGSDSTLVTPDGDRPTYADCANSTRFTNRVESRAGTSFCYIGHGYVVRVTIKASLYNKYDTVELTVWQGALRS